MAIQGSPFLNMHNPHTRSINGTIRIKSCSRIQICVNTTRVRNLKFATYLKFATCENTNKINELW